MANIVHESFLELLWGNDLSADIDTLDVEAALMDVGHTPSGAFDYYDDVSADALATVNVPVTKSGGYITPVTATITWPSVPGGDDFEGFYLYVNTGTPATSPIMCFIDEVTGGGTFSGTTNGGDVDVTLAAHIMRV